MKPFKVVLTLAVEVDPIDFDDDVDWSNPEKVIQDVIETSGWRDLETTRDLHNFKLLGFTIEDFKLGKKK